jgi:hypothetical protein
MNDAKPGLLKRSLCAIQRAVLGKSSGAFLEHLTGSNEYWNRVLAAQAGWPQQSPPGVDETAPLKQGATSEAGSRNKDHQS